MHRSLTAASLLAMALAFAPYAMAGEGHSCCSADKAKKQAATTGAKCDPKNCPPEKCDKAASCDKHQAAAQKTEARKAAPKPQA